MQTFPHSVTNGGNDTDSFTLTVADQGGDNFNIAPQIFADADGNGVADNNTPLTQTPNLEPGATFSFVVVGTVPPTATTVGQFADVRVTATSIFDPTVSDFNTDRVTITNNADLEVTKNISANSGNPVSRALPMAPRLRA